MEHEEIKTTDSEIAKGDKDSLNLDTLNVEAAVKNEIDTKAKQELEKVNVTRMVLDNLSKYKELKLASPTDVEGYKAIVSAKKEVANVRKMAVKICTMNRSRALSEQRAWIAKEKEIVNELQPTEASLEVEIEIFKKEQDRVEREAKEAEEKRINDRIQALLVFNPVFDGNSYRFKERTVDMTLLKLFNDDQYNEFYNLVKEAHEAEIKAKEEAEERARAEAKRLADEREKQEAEAKRLREEAEELARQKEAMRQEKIQARSNELVILGLQYSPRENKYYLGENKVYLQQISELDNNDWNNLLIEIKPQIESYKAQLAKEAEEKRQAEIKKAAEEAAAKAKAEAEAKAKKEREEVEAKANAEKAAAEAKAKAEAQARAKEMTDRRCSRLLRIGLVYNGQHLSYVKDDINVHWTEITTDTEDVFEEKLRKIEAEINRREEAKKKAIADAQEKEQKRKEAMAPDKEKLIKLSKQIETLEVPEFTSPEGQEAGLKVKEQVAKMAAWVLGVANKME